MPFINFSNYQVLVSLILALQLGRQRMSNEKSKDNRKKLSRAKEQFKFYVGKNTSRWYIMQAARLGWTYLYGKPNWKILIANSARKERKFACFVTTHRFINKFRCRKLSWFISLPTQRLVCRWGLMSNGSTDNTV